MGEKLHNRIETWKKQLLDLGKRNRLINFLDGKRNSIKIDAPTFEKLWELLVQQEKELKFPYSERLNIDKCCTNTKETIVAGDIKTNRSIDDLQDTLKTLRNKSKTSLEEQGINTLYLTFGMLNWKERSDSDQVLRSPIFLVPVRLLIESLSSPYRIALRDDDIVVNPTLVHKVNNDFGIEIPNYDEGQQRPLDYLNLLQSKVKVLGWKVDGSIYLTNLSFLKINMYKDLERNKEKLNSNPIISALVGEKSLAQIPSEYINFNHDKLIRPVDTFHVVDADSSQQDAILLSKKGISFVLQGPPGTGKSQTITNIIAEAIASGKKVLFVSEKLAALQVVYNRLANVGLGEFCFTLHSHKAKKKDIITDLYKTTNIRSQVTETAIEQLELLEAKRKLLNDYQEELHTRTSGLNVSIFEVNGLLAKLESKNLPNIIFHISDATTINRSSLNERINNLDELSKTISKLSERYVDNVWRDSIVTELTNALRYEIDANVDGAITLLKELNEHFATIYKKIGIKCGATLEGAKKLLSDLLIIKNHPIIPIEWVTVYDIDLLLDEARKNKELVNQIADIKRELNKKYPKQFFDIDAISIKEDLNSIMQQLYININSIDGNISLQSIKNLSYEIRILAGTINKIFKQAKVVAQKYELKEPNTIGQIREFAKIIKCLIDIRDTHPTKKWFDRDSFEYIKSDFNNQKNLHTRVLENKNAILSQFDKEIFDLDYYPILQKFRSKYNTIYRWIKKQYYRDLNQIRLFLKNGGQLTYEDVINVLNNIKSISETQSIILENQLLYKENFGNYYVGLQTQWDVLYNNIEKFERANNNLDMLSNSLKYAIAAGEILLCEAESFYGNFSELDIESTIEQFNSKLNILIEETTIWGKVLLFVEGCSNTLENYISKIELLEQRNIQTSNHNTLISDLDALISLNALEKEFEDKADSMRSKYKEYFEGEKTDWDNIIQALNYATQLKDIENRYDLQQSRTIDICTSEDILYDCQEEAIWLKENLEEILRYTNWFETLFSANMDFSKYNIQDLAKKMSLCKENKHLLEEWVSYRNSRENCIKIGLGDFVDAVENSEINPNCIVDVYLKRFYCIWMDAILPKFTAVQKFNSRMHEQTISDFRTLDIGQFQIAQARVRALSRNRIPDFNGINNSKDEVSILKREANKQRRLKPIRQLFSEIPNLITTLRPCFMMSPLSVSVFLEANCFDFDMVIFDEASQVHTEDAIGAIIRGKQVIIVGDSKQLPPTSFFTTIINGEEYDIDDNDNCDDIEAGAYESILDEAITFLPERSLRWHYRSRYEDLIAFSNIKIYNGELITFPSAVQKSNDCGVEYVYVKDGVYDRGGKKSNVKEASVVADLVFEHFKKYPNRSLGVVTFSEAQQYAVDAAIRNRRTDDHSLENFFREDNEEPFFIKNLENVQGDERDSIIFSIGYAKDSNGIMYMNFGPLSREGGFRRLNVAITRAKYNVKLVGSIMPTDINLDKVSSEGVKLLRSYIEFAQQGIDVLKNEYIVNDDQVFDSPFEESVYNFLISKGYGVNTQVGCSGFRIDMAIKHPTLSGVYVIGIECDGASYHSTRTVRERDRLRQTILEDMGWTIYRIWSTDWIKDPKNEQEKLIKAISKAIACYNINSKDMKFENDLTTSPSSEFEIIHDSTTKQENKYGFETYQQAEIKKDDIENKKPIPELLLEVIRLEQPIHFDEMCRRIAPAYGYDWSTPSVRKNVEDILEKQFRGTVIKDKKGFVKMLSFTNIKVRVPKLGEVYKRNIAYICDKELALAMEVVSKHNMNIEKWDLFKLTAEIFGFKQVGCNIYNSLDKVFKDLIKRKIIKMRNGKVWHM